jgi:hypothetical protein
MSTSTQAARFAADYLETGENDEACERCGGDGCQHCGGRGLVSAAAPSLDPGAPTTADPTRLVKYLVRLAMEAAHATDDAGALDLRYPESLEERVRERMAQAAQVIVAELDEARSRLAGEVTARQFAAWTSVQDRDGAPRVHQWRDSAGWHVALYVMPHGSDVLRVTEAVAPDPQDALTMLMAGRVAS